VPSEYQSPDNLLNRHRSPATYHPDFLVLPEQDEETVQKVNAFLVENGYAGELELPAEYGVVPVAAVRGADPKDIRDHVRAARGGGARLPRLDLNRRHQRGTYELAYFDSVDDMTAAGRVWGHSFAFATTDMVPAEPKLKLPEHGRRPVIALLDTGVNVANSWFHADDGFLIREWNPPTPVKVVGHDPDFPYADVEASHGTFIAGLIRQYAPAAQILSLKIMREDGGADETNVVEALDYLVRLGEPVDVVQMSFGRTVTDEDDDEDRRLLDRIKQLLIELAGRGVQLVASAGNQSSCEPVYPAGFAAQGVAIHSVGSGTSEDFHDDFSNHGTWVHDWFDGSDQIGPLRDGRWGRWSGTSFAVPVCAASLVDHVFPKQTA